MSPVNPIEAGNGGLWYAKQAALGTIAAPAQATTIRLRKVGSDGFKPAKVLASEEYVDGESWSTPAMYTDSIGGPVGTSTAQAQIETSGVIFAQVLGVDVVTGAPSDYTHTMASGTAQGTYGSWRQQTGVAIGPWQDAYWDSKISKLAWNCGQDQKTAHMAIDVTAIKAGSWYTTPPTAADSGTDPYRWDETAGLVTIDAVAFDEVEGESLELDRKLDVHRGQSAAPVAIVPTKGSIMRNFNAIVTDNTLPKIKLGLFNTATPTDALAINNTPTYLALESLYQRTAVRSLKITTPKVAVHPDDFEVFPRAEGGKIPVVFGGECLKSGATAALTIVAKTGDAASYVA